MNFQTFLLRPEQCFGGFAIAVSRDENGNTEEICGCSGDQCRKSFQIYSELSENL